MPDRATGSKEPTEIEITPAMIEAGEDVLLSTLGGGVQCHWDPRDLATKVFRAMVQSDVQ